MDPDSTAYHISGALRLDGELDVEAVRSCFDALSARHEALRTVFRETEDGEAWQEVLPVLAPEFQLIALSAHAPEERDGAVRAAAEACANRVFDLRQGPLLRVGLIRESAQRHVLVLAMHHIISDGWSLDVLTREFAELYRAARLGGTADLPPLSVQYADYALWQRSWLEAGERERQLAYWRAHLGGKQPVLQLHADGARRSDGQYRAARARAVIPVALVQDLQRLVQARGATLFMVLLAGWQVLLHRYSGMADIRVGIPSANRHRSETSGMLGFFVNTQVLRSELQGEHTLEQALERARTAALAAQEHQDLPFEQLVDALQVERVLGQNPLFQVMYNHQRAGGGLDSLPGLNVTRYELGKQAAQLELVLDTTEHPDGTVEAALTYAAELFGSAAMARMLRHYETVLRHFAEDAGQTLGDMPLLGTQDLAQLAGWGESPLSFDASTPVHRMFEQQAAQTPDAAALTCGGERLTYAALNTRANRLAHYLISLGVGPERKVGVALERGVDMVAALLAVLKSGAAYVPLDPDYPQDRLAYVMQDGGIGHLLTQTALLGRIPQGAATVLALDAHEPLGASWPAAAAHCGNPDVALHGDHLAYAIYTSGSTGKPKGVAVRHEALSHFLLSMREAPGITADNRVLALTSLAFDIAALELFLPLISGAQILLTAQGADDILPMAAQARPAGACCSLPVGSQAASRACAVARRCSPTWQPPCSRPVWSYGICTDRPKRPSGPAYAAWKQAKSPSAVQLPARNCTCWTPRCKPCRRVWRANFTSAASAWRAAI
ncbi:hypothetical protein ASC94_12555 [Massilia sp. Root418]|nr:hypothetical protein ASC94_12555 [Massilia sp. Root418]